MKLTIKNDLLSCTVNEDKKIKVGYSRQFNTVSVLKGEEALNTVSVHRNFKAPEFAEYCQMIKKAFE